MAVHHCVACVKYLIQNNPAVKKGCSPQECCCENGCGIQSCSYFDGKLKAKTLITTIQVNLCSMFHYNSAPNSPEFLLLKFLPLAYHHSHFLATTWIPHLLFTKEFLGATPFFTAGLVWIKFHFFL